MEFPIRKPPLPHNIHLENVQPDTHPIAFGRCLQLGVSTHTRLMKHISHEEASAAKCVFQLKVGALWGARKCCQRQAAKGAKCQAAIYPLQANRRTPQFMPMYLCVVLGFRWVGYNRILLRRGSYSWSEDQALQASITALRSTSHRVWFRVEC